MLNCRIAKGADPIRVICDTNLSIPLDSNIVKTAKSIKTIIAYSNAPDINKINKLKEKEIELINVPYNRWNRFNKTDEYTSVKKEQTVYLQRGEEVLMLLPQMQEQ